VIRLLEEPALIQQELDRRLVAARSSDPTRKREQSLQRELTHVGKGIERLLNAYQEGLLSIEQLRERMPVLRQRQQRLTAELQAIADQTNDRAAFLRLAETLTAFLARLRRAAESLSVLERQRIVRLLVKDVLVGEDTITIRHSIPIPPDPPQSGGSQDSNGQDYLLCKGREHAANGQDDGPPGSYRTMPWGLGLAECQPKPYRTPELLGVRWSSTVQFAPRLCFLGQQQADFVEIPRAKVMGIYPDVHGKRSRSLGEVSMGMSIEMPRATMGAAPDAWHSGRARWAGH